MPWNRMEIENVEAPAPKGLPASYASTPLTSEENDPIKAHEASTTSPVEPGTHVEGTTFFEEVVTPEETEIWKSLVKPEIAQRLDQQIEEIGSLVSKIVSNLGITSMTSLTSIPDHVLLRQGIPAAFCHAIRNGVPTDDIGSTEIEVYLWTNGFDSGLTSREITHLIECIVENHWLETLESLKMLPNSQWNKLGIRDALLVRKVQAMIDKYTSQENLPNKIEPLELTEFFSTNRSEDW
eukprot:Gregarina_sp_Poly_1__7723@NODE_435_length_8451_cov_37_257514_g355_i0_p3_GENE_NODE_435_length_8451_cov_37_257514_g355_i0NODE_435_length_8451_cov_37_257514_g355_i0_p3_ORF_typecomplete_len238_score28_67_NODE_435_length_8451_cov_37_257514_g355_i06181331